MTADVAPSLPEICIVSPCFNEEQVIAAFYQQVCQAIEGIGDARFGILVVDDGSTDNTLAKLNEIAARDCRVRVLSLSRNFGHQMALSAGIDAAAADAVILMDSDLQHPPSLIPEMVSLWRQGFDVVSGIRVDTDGVPAAKKFSSRLFYTVFNVLSETRLTPGAADFCLLSRRAYTGLRSMPERHRVLRALVAWMGFKQAQLPYRAPARAAGHSKYSAGRMIAFAADALVSFSAEPVRLPLRIGLVILAGSALYFLYVLYEVAAGHTVWGWASLACLILGLSGVQLIFLGLFGEYLSRIYEQSKGRPLYLVKFDSAAERVARDQPTVRQ